MHSNIERTIDIIDIAHDVVVQIITEIIIHRKTKVTEAWIRKQILASAIKFYNKAPESLGLNYYDMEKEVNNEITFIIESLKIEINNTRVSNIELFGNNKNKTINISQEFIMTWKKLKMLVYQRKRELEQLQNQHYNPDCPPGWIQVESPKNVSTRKSKFIDMQERISKRRNGEE